MQSWNSYSLSSGKSMNRGFASQWAKRLEEEEEKMREQEILEAQKNAANDKAQEDEKPWYQGALDAGAAVGNFVKDAAVDVYKTGESAVTGIKDVAEGQIAANKMGGVTERVNELNKKRSDYMDTLSESDFDKPEVKKKLDEMQKEVERVQNEINDDDRKQMDESQAVDAKKVAADTAETFLNVATAGTGIGLKAGAKQGLKMGAKQFSKQGAKDIAKATGRGAAEGATFSGAAGLTDAISEDMEAEDAVENIAKSATFGALLGGASAGVGKGLGVRKNNKAFNAQEAAAAADNAAVAKVGDDVDGLVDDLQKSKDRPFNELADEDLQREIDAFDSGEARTGDVRADYARYQQLKDEVGFRQTDADRESFLTNGLPNDVDGAQKVLDDFDSGNMPESVYQEAKPVVSAEEIVQREDMPVEIKNAAQEVETDRAMVRQQMEGLMSPETKADEIARLDEQYDLKMQELTRRYSRLEEPVKGKDTTVDQTTSGQRLSGDYKSDVRFSMAKEQLDNDYRDAVAELDMLEAQDAEEVAKFADILDKLDTREQSLVADTRQLMREAAGEFRDINPDEQAAQRALLEQNLEQAQRFNEPARVIEEVSSASDPVKAFDRNPDAPAAFKAEVSKEIDSMPANNEVVQKNFKNITGLKLSVLRGMSPSQVLEKMGLRNNEINMFQDILRAESAVNAANKADSTVLERIAKILPDDKQAQAQIIDYLEGKRQTLNVGDQESATMIKAWLDEKKAGLENAGFGTIEDYFPHIFDKKDPEVQRLFKGKTTGEISFSNLKARLADSEDYSRDIMDVLATYATGYNRKTILEPAIKPLADLKTQVKLADAEAKWLDGYVEQLMGFNKSTVGEGYNQFMDNVMDKVGMTSQVGKNHYNSHLGTQRMFSAVATMGLNPGTAIRNTTQMVNTVADIGPRYSTIGLMDGLRALRAGKGSAEWAELQRVGIMEGGVSQNYFDAITSTGVRGRITKGRDAATKGLMSLIRGTDIMLRSQAYYGAKALGAKQGLTGEALEKFAADKVVDTQFITSRVDMPLAFNGQGVRSLTQLATFSGKQAGFLKRTGVKMVKDKDGNWHMDPKAMGSVLSAVTLAAVTTEALKPLMGFREEEWIPFYDQFAPFVPEEALNAVGLDKSGGDSLYRSPLVRLLAGDGKSKIGLIQALQGQDVNGDDTNTLGEGFEKFISDNWSQIVPMGTQIKKSIEGLGTTQSGESRNASGKLRYLQDMGVGDQFKAFLFGQYSTEAGRNWIEEGFPTLSESQTETVDALPNRQAKEQYVDFYQAAKKANGRQKAYDEVKAAAEAGDINRATRAAQEYNQKLEDAMSEYWDKHDELPEDLQEIMLGRMYINVNKVVDRVTEDEE